MERCGVGDRDIRWQYLEGRVADRKMKLSPKSAGPRPTRWYITAGLLLSVCLVAAGDVSGRAGGGGGYSGGGGGYSSSSSGSYSGGSYSSGSGGGGFDFETKASPRTAAILLSIIAVVVGLKGWEIYQELQGPPLRGDNECWIDVDVHEGIVKQVQEVDPEFDPSVFLSQVKGAFVRIQEAWMKQDMSPVEPFVTDGICEKFSVQFRLQQRLGYREELSDIEIHQSRLARFDSRGVFEVLSVKLVASLVDQRVSATTGKVLSGSASSESFTEFWSFVRRRGRRSEENRGALLEGDCPNCGSAVVLNQFGKCRSCDGQVRSGVYDWVLSEITQESEWREKVPRRVVNAARSYREQYDASFSAQQLEDRASVIFARQEMADAEGTLDALRKMASPGYCASYDGHRKETFRGDLSIGALDLAGILIEAEKHYALLDVHWAGKLFTRGEADSISAGEKWKRFRHQMVLVRQAGVQSNLDVAMQSSHCPSCGAVEEELAVDSCPYCQAHTATGQYDWVLEGWAPYHSKRARQLRELIHTVVAKQTAARESEDSVAATENGASRTDCLMWAIDVLAEDGKLDESERRAIAQVASKNRIRTGVVDGWIEDALAGTLKSPQSPQRDVARGWLGLLVEAAVTDGDLDIEERLLLSELANRLKFSSYDLDLVIRKKMGAREAG